MSEKTDTVERHFWPRKHCRICGEEFWGRNTCCPLHSATERRVKHRVTEIIAQEGEKAAKDYLALRILRGKASQMFSQQALDELNGKNRKRSQQRAYSGTGKRKPHESGRKPSKPTRGGAPAVRKRPSITETPKPPQVH